MNNDHIQGKMGPHLRLPFFSGKKRNPPKSCWRLYCWEKPALATLYMNTVVSQCSDCRISLINIEISVPTTGINSGDTNAPPKCRGRGTFIPLIRCVFCLNTNVVEIYRLCILEPNFPPFSKINPPKQGQNSNQNKGHHLGSRYMIVYVLKTVVVSYYNFKSRYFEW